MMINLNKIQKSISTLSVGVLLLFSTGFASAGFIEGNIGFGGSVIPLDDSNVATTLDDAVSLDFMAGVVTLSTLDFATHAPAFGTPAIFTDFTFAPFSGPIAPLWTAGGFSFTLNTININTQNASTLSLVGTGLVSGNGFEVTEGTFNFSANPAGSAFVFSAGTGIPLPGTLALFGLGLLGFGLFRKSNV